MAARRLPLVISTINVAGIRKDESRSPSAASPGLTRASMPIRKPCTSNTPKNFQGSTLRSASQG